MSDEPVERPADPDRWTMDDALMERMLDYADSIGVHRSVMLRAWLQARDRIERPGLLDQPIPNFTVLRAQLREFMHFDVYEHETYRWGDAEAITGIPWLTQLKLIFHGQWSSPLLAWDEDDQELFVQDVRAGMGWERLARIHHLPVSQARTLVKFFRTPPDTSRIGVDDG